MKQTLSGMTGSYASNIREGVDEMLRTFNDMDDKSYESSGNMEVLGLKFDDMVNRFPVPPLQGSFGGFSSNSGIQNTSTGGTIK